MAIKLTTTPKSSIVCHMLYMWDESQLHLPDKWAFDHIRVFSFFFLRRVQMGDNATGNSWRRSSDWIEWQMEKGHRSAIRRHAYAHVCAISFLLSFSHFSIVSSVLIQLDFIQLWLPPAPFLPPCLINTNQCCLANSNETHELKVFMSQDLNMLAKGFKNPFVCCVLK